MCKYFDPQNQIIFIFNEFEGKSCKKSSGIFAINRIFFSQIYYVFAKIFAKI
jgi:hypothetical protein